VAHSKSALCRPHAILQCQSSFYQGVWHGIDLLGSCRCHVPDLVAFYYGSRLVERFTQFWLERQDLENSTCEIFIL
jgi:hypothetical protein